MVSTTNDTADGVSDGDGEKPNWWGLFAFLFFYIMILIIGVYASWKKKVNKSNDSSDIMLAGRDIGLLVGVFTMTATWMDGAFINGTAEIVYSKGLVWAQAPIGYSIALSLGGIFFARKMREARYVTMLDPFQQKYGNLMTAILYIPAFMAELFWCSAMLAVLGSTLSVILHINFTLAIIISAVFTILYTVIGGMVSVVYTDIPCMILLVVGLWLGVGVALSNDAVTPLGQTMHENPPWFTGSDIPGSNVTWMGEFPTGPALSYWIDSALMVMFGGIPWQVYFQRVLSSRTPATAQILSFVASAGCLFLLIPAILLGAIAKSTDWSQTEYRGEFPLPESAFPHVGPLTLDYLLPKPLAMLALGAIGAAVLSTTDASILAISSMFTTNIYTPVRNSCMARSAKHKESDTSQLVLDKADSKELCQKEIIWVVRVTIILVGLLATFVAIASNSIYALWYLCSDLVFVILFPQLILVLYLARGNTYGSLTGCILGLLLRITGGERMIGFDAPVHYPGWTQREDGLVMNNFPIKTLSMLINMLSTILISHLTHYLFTKGILPVKADIFHCVTNKQHKEEDSSATPAAAAEDTTTDQSTNGL